MRRLPSSVNGPSLIQALSLVAIAVGLAFAIYPSADAAAGPRLTYLSEGLVDDPAFQSSAQAVRRFWYGRAEHIGSTEVRLNAVWASIAPATRGAGFRASNPGARGYHWTALDAAVRQATADGQTVLLMAVGAPAWAEGPNRPSYVAPRAWEPSPRAYAAFGHALALRYSGHFPDPLVRGHTLPRVTDFQAWNEPNLPLYLMPQWTHGPGSSIIPSSPGIYRGLLNAFYAAVKAVQPSSYVLSAGTAPYGDAPGVSRMKPLTFLRGLFCLSVRLRAQHCADPPYLDALDHHPYAISPLVRARVSGDVSVPDLSQIWRILRAAERVKHVRPQGEKSLWVTEFGFSSRPADSVTLRRQAQYLSEALYEFWRQGVGHAFWFQLRDPLTPNGPFTNGGLYLDTGVAKSSATAFRFPFVALPAPHNSTILWGKAPHGRIVTIERNVDHSWRLFLRVRTSSGGIFYLRHNLHSPGPLRAKVGRLASLSTS